MSPTPVTSSFHRNRLANYLIDGTVCNAFAIGHFGMEDDFFLIGAEQPGESNEPLITANLLDANGKVLCRIVRNMLVANPGQCRKVLGERVGYQIHDRDGRTIFAVQTRLLQLPGDIDASFVMTIAGRFHDKTGKLVLQATDAGGDETLDAELPAGFGLSGSFGREQQLSEGASIVARLMLLTHGAIHYLISGDVTSRTVTLDGALISDGRFSGCKLSSSTGEFAFLGKDNAFIDCHFEFDGPAGNVRNLMVELMQASSRRIPTS